MPESIILSFLFNCFLRLNNYYKNSTLHKFLNFLSEWISNQIVRSKIISFFSKSWNEEICWTNSLFYKIFVKPIVRRKTIKTKSIILTSKNSISKDDKSSINYRTISIAIAAVLGLIIGGLGAIYSITNVLQILAVFIGILLIIWKVEIGILLTVILVSFLPTMAMVGLIMLTFLSFILHYAFDNNFKFKTQYFDIYILLFSALLMYNSVTSLARRNSLQIVSVYIVFILFYFIFTYTIKTSKQLYYIVGIFLFSGFIVALYGIYQYVTGDVGAQSWIDGEMFKDIKIRVYSTFANPNVLGEYLLLLIPVSIGFLWTAKKWRSKITFAIFSAAMIICLILTYSRGCWLGLIFALAIFAFFADRRLLLLAVLGLFIIPFLLPPAIITRFTSIGNLQDTSSSYRLFIWLGTINMLRDYWISGIGIGTEAFNKIYPFYAYSGINAPHSHNLYLQILSEMGVPGLIAFLLVIFTFYKTMLTSYFQTNDKFLKVFLVSICAGMAGYLLQGMFDNVWYNYKVFLIFWMFISFGISASNIIDLTSKKLSEKTGGKNVKSN